MQAVDVTSDEVRRIMEVVPKVCDNRCKLAGVAQRLATTDLVQQLLEEMPNLPESKRSILLFQDPTVWLLGWKQGDLTTIHDHGASVAGVMVLSGAITEHLYAYDHKTAVRNTNWFQGHKMERDFHAGSTVTIPAPYIHRFQSAIPEGVTVTLHVYSPALTDQGYYELGPNPWSTRHLLDGESWLRLTSEDKS